MTRALRPFALLLALVPGGCVVADVAKTTFDVVTLPVKVVARTANAVLPTQKKADEKRGRELRKADEERGKQARAAEAAAKNGSIVTPPR